MEKCCVVLPKNTQRAIIEIHLITLNVRKGTVTAMINSKRKNTVTPEETIVITQIVSTKVAVSEYRIV